MERALKLAHVSGLVLFLGSILVFTLISGLTRKGGLAELALGRQIINLGTHVLTIPGMWVMALSGTSLAFLNRFHPPHFLRIKLALMVLIMFTAHFLIVPTVDTATDLAGHSAAEGRLSPEYWAAYERETLFGGLNCCFQSPLPPYVCGRAACLEIEAPP